MKPEFYQLVFNINSFLSMINTKEEIDRINTLCSIVRYLKEYEEELGWAFKNPEVITLCINEICKNFEFDSYEYKEELSVILENIIFSHYDD